MHGKIAVAMLVMWCFSLSSLSLFSGDSTPKLTKEYQVKALLLMKFFYFIKWPGNPGNEGKPKPLVLGLIGKNPFGPYLAQRCSVTRVRNRPVEFRAVSSLKEIDGCDMLFISGSGKKELSRILSGIQNKPILTVGDTRGFSRKGVHINLTVINGSRVGFEVNTQSLEESALSAGSVLLRYAEIVKPRGKGSVR
ncbi:MAG: YfiR family protein [bacterium]|nr:YfiR family protein [bacterium]